ncbi:MAG TPA: hypothetical protein EYN72_05970 [Dehalococcoidia bacterium]|nr:hypothetical protein [Dehalococcoidia bacterium]HIN72629.1 hypothetical protein [Dehalococcoidia bacterium]
MKIIAYIRNPDEDLKRRLSIAVFALAAAIVLSVMAPQPSEANVYRIIVLAIVVLLFIARALTFGMCLGQPDDCGYSEAGSSAKFVSHSLSIKPREHNTQ